MSGRAMEKIGARVGAKAKAGAKIGTAETKHRFKPSERVVTFPHMGRYHIMIARILEALGCEALPAPPISKKTVEEGVRVSPEMICFPFKVNMGNYLAAIRQGANTAAMFDSRGQCRFSYYSVLQKKLLEESGQDVDFFIFSGRDFWKVFKEMCGATILRQTRAGIIGLKYMRAIERVEDLAWRYRAIEREQGATSKVAEAAMKMIEGTRAARGLGRVMRKVRRMFRRIEINRDFEPMKIGVIGEIYLAIEPYVNHDVEEMLGELGCEIKREIRLSTFLEHGIDPMHKKKMYRRAKGYLGTFVGGHGLESVADMLEYAHEKYDGVVHLAPFGCMPETTVRPILTRISKEYKLPLISLTYDEQSSKAGIQTRIEAFVDMIKKKKK